MKIKMGVFAVAEIVGAIFLLAIAICVASGIYMQVLSNPGPSEETYVNLIGKMETGNPIFEHRRGEGINTDSKVIIIPRGDLKDRNITTVAELLDPITSNGDNIWDIGERLVYPHILAGWNVEANIVDSKSNSIVFWGTLQEGYIEPPFGMGGIWHFNESFWSGTFYDVKDSSGNMNHGIARFGANTDAFAKSNRSGNFTKPYSNVQVPDDPSLDITEAISVEAWIYPKEPDIELTTFRTDQAFAYDPKIIRISDNVYAIASGQAPPSQHALLMTVEILPNGSIRFPSISNYKIDITPNDKGYHPDIIHLINDSYLIAYSTKNASNTPGLLKLININPDGNLSNLSSEILLNGFNGLTPSLIKVSDDIFAVAYTGPDDDGWIKTLNMSDGNFNGFVWEKEFDTTNCYDPDIINISNNIFTVAYSGPDDDGWIKTLNISSEGTSIEEENYFEFDESECFTPNITHISGDIYAIVYRGPNKDGVIKTIDISSDGKTIKNNTIYNNTLIFDYGECYNPKITQILDEHYAIVYSTGDEDGSSEGILIRVKIALNGTISRNIETIDNHIGDPKKDKLFEPDIIQISPLLTAVVYRESTPHEGLITIFRTGDDLIPISERGIVKSGSASLYADTSRVYGSINGENQIISLPINGNAWNHIVLTYDHSTIRLYCNFDGIRTLGIDYIELSYNQDINQNDKDLLFGYLYTGFIDEIAIFDHAIDESEILYHQTCIGCYEVN